jgi:hypothetical protein
MRLMKIGIAGLRMRLGAVGTLVAHVGHSASAVLTECRTALQDSSGRESETTRTPEVSSASSSGTWEVPGVSGAPAVRLLLLKTQ